MKRYFHNSLKKSLLTLSGLVLFFGVNWGQATLPLSRTIWNAGAPTGWTDGNGTTPAYTTTFACSGSNGGRLDNSGEYYSVYFSSTPDQLTYTLKITGNTTSNCLTEESSDGSAWTTIVNHTPLPTTCVSYNYTLNSASRYVRWTYTKVTENLTIDDVSITSAIPTITVSPSSISGFTYIVGNGPSASQTYSLSGSNLTGFPGNIVVTGSADYQVSLDNSAFSGSVNVAYSSATLGATTIYVRLKSGLSAGTYNGETITNAGGGATTKNVTCNGNVTVSSSSDVINVSSSEAATVSSIINTSGPLTSVQGTQVWQFIIRDGGASADADNLPTIVNAITIANLNSAGLDWSTAIQSIDLFDGSTNVGSLQNGSASLTATAAAFTGLNITVGDNSTKTITVRLTVRCPLGSGNIEGDYFRFSITPANFTTAGSATSSQKNSTFTAAQSSGTSPRNDISVVATRLTFTQQPTSTGTNQNMAPAVTVSATDACGNTDINFTGTVTITSTGTMTGSPVSVAAVAGVATFGSVVHTVVGTGFSLNATTTGLTSATSNNFDIYLVTTFIGGDMAIVGICVNQGNHVSCTGVSSEDEISIVSFVDIAPGTTFDITDNGYERVGCSSGNWGNTEGVIRITRNTSTITAGTIITFRVMDNTIFSGVSPDNNWTVSYPVGWQFNLNNNDEQVYMMQGGTWNAGTLNNHDATYTGGTYMFAINTYTAWSCNDNTTTRGALPLALRCFSIMPATGTVNVKYTGNVTPANKKDWIDRLNSPSNWSSSTDCSIYNGQTPNYSGGYSFTILAGGFSAGMWTGAANTDWFDCNNWQNYEVPVSSTNVTIPNQVNDPVIGVPPALYPGGAVSNDLTLTSDPGILTINNASSILSIYGNITNNGTFSHTNGLVNIRNANSTLSSVSPMTFYNLTLNKTANTNTFTIGNDISVSNTLTLTSGILTTGNNKVIVTNTSTGSVTGFGTNSYINGNLRRSILSSGSYDFPVGTSAQYEASNITLNSSSGINYFDAKFTSPHSTPIDITALGLVLNGSNITTLLDYGFWTFTPDALTTVNYDVTLTSTGHTNGGTAANQHTIVKRTDSSANWAVYPANHNNATQSGTGTSPITAKLSGLTSFSDFAIARSNTFPLPVELTVFTGKQLDNKIILSWQTLSETNNDYFEIEKSHDLNSFTKTGTIAGAGNSNTLLHYSFTDDNPFPGNNYYKLRQVDYNGRSSESNIIVVNVYHNSLVNVFVSENSTLNISAANSRIQRIEISDVTGKNISGLNNFNDNSDIQFNITGISPGIYFVRIIGDTFTETRKMYFP